MKIPEIGICFAVGPVAPVLLKEMEGKILVEFSGGLKGILLDHAINPVAITTNVKPTR